MKTIEIHPQDFSDLVAMCSDFHYSMNDIWKKFLEDYSHTVEGFQYLSDVYTTNYQTKIIFEDAGCNDKDSTFCIVPKK